MKLILKYLNNPKFSFEFRSDDIDETLADNTYASFIEEMGHTDGNNTATPLPHLTPKPGIGQIWLCRQEFVDRKGLTIKGDIPYYIIIVDNPGNLGDLNFVRVQPLSMFTEFEAGDDRVVEDESITGFKFLIETWNEQPIDVDLLQNYIGSIDLQIPYEDQEVTLTQYQRDFRKVEIENTAYLRQSVVSYLVSKEKYVVRKKVVINILMAAVLIGIAYILWQPFKMGNNAIFETYAVTYPSQSVLGLTSETRNIQGDTCILENLSFEECLKADDALKLYDKGQFGNAKDLLNEILVPKDKNIDLLLYLAFSQLKTDEVIASIENFEFLKGLDNYKYVDEVNYYLAVAYIKEGELSKARKILHEIEESDSKYQNEANTILKQLRWF